MILFRVMLWTGAKPGFCSGKGLEPNVQIFLSEKYFKRQYAEQTGAI